MRSPLIIYGAGGLGKEILSLVNALDAFEVIGFLDDHVAKGTLIKGIKILGARHVLDAFEQPPLVVLALGDPTAKASLAKAIGQHAEYPKIIHPSVILQDTGSIVVGPGTVLCAGCILTTDVVIGAHVLVNLNCSIGHDSKIGNFSSLMPGVNVAGEVVIGNEVLIGAGSSIMNRIMVGDKSKIGMGSVVIRDVPTAGMVAGVPAQPIVSKSMGQKS